MNRELLIGRILEDESLRGDLDDDAAEPLIAWLVKRAEAVISRSKSESAARQAIDALCQRGRLIARFVNQAQADPAAAARLAQAEKLAWPLPAAGTGNLAIVVQHVLDSEHV